MRIGTRDLFSRQDIPGEIISVRKSLLYHFGNATWDLRAAYRYLSPDLAPPGLVLGLRHNENQQRDPDTGAYIALFSASARATGLQQMDGGDLGAGLHRGYEWWMVQDRPLLDPTSVQLPAGIVCGLKHSLNQAGQNITVFGCDPVRDDPPSGFQREIGGDLGAPSGQGYYWYETTGEGFSGDWRAAEQTLPRWLVLGLKHSRNQRDKTVTWRGREYDPVTDAPPPGFERRAGGDLDGGEGEGYYWYEKVKGPEIVIKPTLTVRLQRSLYLGPGDNPELDRDGDGLVDTLEGLLAQAFRPYVIFDSHEIAREDHEPVVLFQVHPLESRGSTQRVAIKWAFLFKQDGGYGPASWCGDSHAGDNDDALFELESEDGGVTWILSRAILGLWQSPESIEGGGFIEWPKTSRLEMFNLTHPVVYMSASKHHEYFNRDYDESDSHYSDYGCNDNVNGRGARFLVDIHTLEKRPGYFNNVGEPEQDSKQHPSPPFIDDLYPYYSGESAWGEIAFCGGGDPMAKKWIRLENGKLIYG